MLASLKCLMLCKEPDGTFLLKAVGETLKDNRTGLSSVSFSSLVSLVQNITDGPDNTDITLLLS